VEVHCGIMCASAPALKVFFKRYLSVGSSRDGIGNNRGPGYEGVARPGYDEGVGPRILSKGLKFMDISQDSGTGSEGSVYANGSSVVGYETMVFGEKTQVEGWGGNVSAEHAVGMSAEEIGGNDNSLFTAYPVDNRTRSPGATRSPGYPRSPQRLRKEQYIQYTPFSAI
jgi:hypothetical protein